jgi:adenylate cyclase
VTTSPRRSSDERFADLLHQLGASDERIAEVLESGTAERLAGDLVLLRGADMTASDLARASGVDEDKVVHLWRDLGIVAQPGEIRFGTRDLEVIKLLASASDLEIRGAELLRVIGAAMGTIADAAVAHYVQDVEERLRSSGIDPVERAQELADTIDFAFRIGDSLLGPVLAQHLRDAVARQRATQQGVSDRVVARLAIGFVDLVGSTQLANRVSSRDLLETISTFEARAFEVAAARGGRVVKHVGDEVMFMALSPGVACDIALSLVEQFSAGAVQPRGGVAFGEVITYHGDFYGPVVNLASRLTDQAVRGEVLVDSAVRDTSASSGTEIEFEPAGRRQLKGFDDPVSAFSLSRTTASDLSRSDPDGSKSDR